jgi:hypothetical protein
MAVANTLLGTSNAIDVYQAISSISDLPSTLDSLIKTLPDAAKGLSSLSGGELITLLNALSNFAMDPQGAADEISDNLSVIDSAASEMLASGNLGTTLERKAVGTFVAYLNDAVLAEIISDQTGLEMFLSQIIIERSVLNNPSLRSDTVFLNQKVSVPREGLLGLLIGGATFIPLKDAISKGYYWLP